MKKLLVLLILIGLLVFGVSQAYAYYNSQLDTPASSSAEAVAFRVTPDESTGEIADDLRAKGLIKSSEVFELYVRLNNLAPTFQAGDYQLSRRMTPRQIVAQLQHATTKQFQFTIPEGYSLKRIAAKWEAEGHGKAQDYIDAANPAAWQQYDFVAARPRVGGRENNLEGYLYPDTYSLNVGAGAKDLVQAQLEQFKTVIAPVRATIQQKGMTIDQIVTMASMVDREVQSNPNRAIVCGIYLNRLDIHNALDVDATVLYALGRTSGAQTVTQEDLHAAAGSPYDTYTHPGLPPGPISNPGKDAVDGCVAPQDRDKHYLFYFAGCDGHTHFATTEADFEAQEARFGVVGGRC